MSYRTLQRLQRQDRHRVLHISSRNPPIYRTRTYKLKPSIYILNIPTYQYNIDPGKPAAGSFPNIKDPIVQRHPVPTVSFPRYPFDFFSESDEAKSSHSTLHTSHCTLRTPNFKLHTPHFTLHTSHFSLLPSHSKPHTSHFTLHTALFALQTETSHSTLHTSTHHTFHFPLLPSHFTLHTALFTPHTSHCSKPTFNKKTLVPKWRKSANKSIRKTLRMQPKQEATLTQPFQCDLRRLKLRNTIELRAMASEIVAPKPDLDARAKKRRF